MHDQSGLFGRLRLMIAKLLARGGDIPPFSGPADPFARVRVPRPARPPGGGASIALAEPDDEPELVSAIGTVRRR